MEENQTFEMKPSVGQSALSYALIYGLAMVVIHLVLFLFDAQQSIAGMIVSSVLSIAGIVLIMLHFRGKLGGYITYGKAVRIGFVSLLFASVIYSGYTFVYHSYVNPTELKEAYVEKYKEAAAGIDKDESIAPENKESVKKVTKKYMAYGFIPWVVSVVTVFMFALFGIIISLIIAIFIKRNPPLQIYEDPA
jgi:hypothetical protein